jgi:hypothetical protein
MNRRRPPEQYRAPVAGRTLRLCLLALVCVVSAAGSARGQVDGPWATSGAVGLGPIVMRPQSPLTLFRVQPTPGTPEVLAPGQWQFGVFSSWNIYFAYEPGRYTIDAETLRFTLAATCGLDRRWDVGLNLPVSYRGGGVMDGLIEAVEKALGVPNMDRRRFPRDRYLIRLHGPGGQVLERSGAASGWGLEDATLTLRYQIARGDEEEPALTAGLLLKLPAGRQDALRSSAGFDFGLALSYGQRLGKRTHLYVNTAVIRYNSAEIAGIALHRVQASISACFEYRHSPRTSWLVQGMTLTAGAMHDGNLAKATYEITAGFKHLLSRQLLLEASLLENLFVFDNSPDFGVHLGLVWRPGRSR